MCLGSSCQECNVHTSHSHCRLTVTPFSTLPPSFISTCAPTFGGTLLLKIAPSLTLHCRLKAPGHTFHHCQALAAPDVSVASAFAFAQDSQGLHMVGGIHSTITSILEEFWVFCL